MSYLRVRGRLPAFINKLKGADTPTRSRREYADYMTWAADRIRELAGGEFELGTRYGKDVVSESLSGGKSVTVLSQVHKFKTGEIRTRTISYSSCLTRFSTYHFEIP